MDRFRQDLVSALRNVRQVPRRLRGRDPFTGWGPRRNDGDADRSERAVPESAAVVPGPRAAFPRPGRDASAARPAAGQPCTDRAVQDLARGSDRRRDRRFDRAADARGAGRRTNGPTARPLGHAGILLGDRRPAGRWPRDSGNGFRLRASGLELSRLAGAVQKGAPISSASRCGSTTSRIPLWRSCPTASGFRRWIRRSGRRWR